MTERRRSLNIEFIIVLLLDNKYNLKAGPHCILLYFRKKYGMAYNVFQILNLPKFR